MKKWNVWKWSKTSGNAKMFSAGRDPNFLPSFSLKGCRLKHFLILFLSTDNKICTTLSHGLGTWLRKKRFERTLLCLQTDTWVTADHNCGSTVDIWIPDALWETDSAAEPSGGLVVLPDSRTSSDADAAVAWSTSRWVVTVVSVSGLWVCADVIKACVLKIAVAMEMRSSDSVDTECENLQRIF